MKTKLMVVRFFKYFFSRWAKLVSLIKILDFERKEIKRFGKAPADIEVSVLGLPKLLLPGLVWP